MKKMPLVLGLVLLQAATLARAQTGGDEPAQTETTQPQSLAGPRVPEAEPRTLVVYEYGGELQPLGLPAPEAALELLELDEATSRRVAAVLTERAMLAEKLITDNFDLLSQSETVEASESKLAKGVFFLEVLRVLQPLAERGPLEDEIRPLLPAEQAAEFDRLLDGYWRAVGEARVAEARRGGERLQLRRAIRQARRDQLGREVELAAERALESERFAVAYLTKGLDLSPEQHAIIERLVNDFVGKTMGEAGENEKEQLFLSVLAFLNEPQRAMLIERIKGL